MKRLPILIFTALLALACGLPLAGTPTTQPTVLPPPTAAPAIPALVETMPPTQFRDDFEASLDPGWQWSSENPASWSLTTVAGALQITAGGGHVNLGDISNLLLRAAPQGDFELETRLTFKPVGNFQFAGLLIYEAPSDFMQAGRAFCNVSGCVGDGLYFDLAENNNYRQPNYALRYSGGDVVYLRLRREGNTYTFTYSPDGQSWTTVGTRDSQVTPLKIGLVAGQSESGTIPANFDYFQSTTLP